MRTGWMENRRGATLTGRRRSAGGLIAVGALVGALSSLAPGWAAPATADDTVVLTCDETGTVEWLGAGINGAEMNKAPVGWKSDKHYTNCVGPNGAKLDAYPQESIADGSELASCDDLAAHTGNGIMIWSDGSNSLFEQKASTQAESGGGDGGTFTLTLGAGGPFAGDTAVDRNQLTVGGPCPGLKNGTSKGTFTIHKR